MPHETDFFRSIAAEAEADEPRLVYADWLEESGQPEKAEFVRVQCELARVQQIDREQAKQLHQREYQLWQQHHRVWKEALPPLEGKVYWAHYTRGIIEGIQVHRWEDFERQAELIFSLPVTTLYCRMWSQEIRLAQVARWPGLQRIRHLHFAPGYRNVTDQAIRELAASPYTSHLRGLNLSTCELTSRGAELLASSDRFEQLRHLSLGSNQIDDAGGNALLESPHFPQLERISLINNPLSQAFRERASQSQRPVVICGSKVE